MEQDSHIWDTMQELNRQIKSLTADNQRLRERGDLMAKEYSGILNEYNKTLPEDDFMDFQTIGEWYEISDPSKLLTPPTGD